MNAKNYFELVCQGLPGDVNPQELKVFGKPEWWQNKPRLACAYALRKCPRINWQAYLLNNPDVAKSGMDPVYHFLKHGLYEGRKLYSWHPVHQQPAKGSPPAPRVSVIVPNYNNAIYLHKCLNSLVQQTMRDIEIIVVDDGSSDNSLDIIKSFQQRDDRIRLIAFDHNKSQFMARKAGVAIATGDYVMFLDPDDSYVLNTCEKAWKAIARGYDIVSFNITSVNLVGIPEHEVKYGDGMANKAPAGEYSGDELLRLTFIEGIFKFSVCTKIFERQLLQVAFSRLEDGYFMPLEDAYELLPVLHLARNMLKIDENIYIHTRGVGTSTYRGSEDETLRRPNMGKMLEAAKRYCDKHSLGKYFLGLKAACFHNFAGMLPMLDPKFSGFFLDELAKTYGIPWSINALAIKFGYKIDEFLKLLQPRHDRPDNTKSIKKIGILYIDITPGGIQRTIQNICSILPKAGYEISLFLTNKSDNDLEIDPAIKRYYLSPYGKDQGKSHIEDLYGALLEARPDIVIHMDAHWHPLAWQLLLLRMMGLPVIGSMRVDPCWDFAYRGEVLSHAERINILRCLDKLFCLNVSTEMYLRAQGIDATYLPNPVRKFDTPPPAEKSGATIAVLARLSDARKKMDHCIRTLAEVRKNRPDATMLFIGDFASKETREKFYARAREYGVNGHVRVSGWVDNPAPLLDGARILFSASYMEGFPNNVAEAQARGLPVVMYDLDITLADNNESIIIAPQDDFKAAAQAICRLLGDEAELQRLSLIAIKKAAEFSAARFVNGLINLLETYGKKSDFRVYDTREWQRALRYMTFYTGKKIPSYCG